MIKTLLLCFIHGFKGNDETFYQFPTDLQNLVAEIEPDLNVHVAVYPKYETRGDLAACVETFREWLQGQVADLERDAATPQAIMNPSVGVILVSHSMGGFVAADTLFSVLDNRPVSANPKQTLLFPLLLGLVAFDTPFNGLSRSMFAYGAFSQYRNISSIWNIGTSVSSLVLGQAAVSAATSTATRSALSAPASRNPNWLRWQLLASRTGTYGAILAGGVAAYVNRNEIAAALKAVNRENISQSWSKVNRENIGSAIAAVPAYVSRDSIGEGFAWMASHLKFVGALMKQAQLQTRLQRLESLSGMGLANFYTSLGANGYWAGGYFIPKRTFCAVPAAVRKGEAEKGEQSMLKWTELANSDAKDEIAAHCSMFQPAKNPKYKEMCVAARDLVQSWTKNDPRNVVDEFVPSREQRERSKSEAQLWDDDGKVLSPASAHSEQPPSKAGTETEEIEEDELQLKAISSSTDLPLPEDGGLSDEDLKKAAEVPLPSEEVSEEAMRKLWDADSKTWKERVLSPFSGVSMPAIPAMPQIPHLPAVRFPGRSKHDSAVLVGGNAEKQETGTEEAAGKVTEKTALNQQPEDSKV